MKTAEVYLLIFTLFVPGFTGMEIVARTFEHKITEKSPIKKIVSGSKEDIDIFRVDYFYRQQFNKWQDDELSTSFALSERSEWMHYSSANGDFAAPGVGEQAALLLLDIDKDEKDEIIVAGWGDTSIIWYKQKENTWERYLLDESNSPSIGGTFYDLDGDGDLDVLFGGAWQSNEIWWWENPFPDYDPQTAWVKHTIRDTGAKGYHNQIFGDFDGNGKVELVVWNKRSGKLLIADIPSKPIDKNAWKFKDIWSWKGETNYEGLTKTDINQDGKEDIIGGGYWFEHVCNDDYKACKIDSYGESSSAAGDLIKGGRPEVVLSSADGVGPLNLYQWKNENWEKTTLIEKVVHGHTLQIIDVDGDDKLDIFCAEMAEWAGGKNHGSKAWILYGDADGNFSKELLNRMTDIGNHESRIGDVNGDGRPDIVQKPFMKGIPQLDIWLNKKNNKSK